MKIIIICNAGGITAVLLYCCSTDAADKVDEWDEFHSNLSLIE